MLKQGEAALDAVFQALAHPVRRAIVHRLAQGDASVTELAEPHDMTLSAISQHLRVLERAGLLEQTRDWRVRRCRLQAKPLSDAFGWIVRYRIFWDSILDHVQQQVEEPE